MVDYPFTIRDHDDSEIPTPKDMMTILLDVFFYNASYNDEGAVADFTNLETIVNVRRTAAFKNSEIWILVDLPYGKKAIGTKWVYRNKKDERGVVVRNKARLVAQGHRQEEGIDYDEVFAPVARIEAIRIFLAFASYMGFIVYQMDVKSAFLYGKIDEEDKYVTEILKKFDFVSVKTASTPVETQKPLVKDEEASDVDVHLYRSMIGSLMYLTASRPAIMFVKCAFLGNPPSTLILEDPNSAVQTRSKVTKSSVAHAFILIDLPYGKKAIGTKWVYRNKKDERGVVVRNKARLVAQGHREEEGIDYDEVFAPVARIEAIRIFLAFASYMGFIVYQMDVKSAFMYGKINEGYVSQPPGFVDPKYPKKVYKVVKALYGLHQAPRAWYATLSTFLLKSGYRRGTIDKTLFIKKDKNDIMFQVTPKTSHLNAVKRIFRYLKGKPKLGLWYPSVSSFDLEAYSDSDYIGANIDRKSTTGGCQFLGRRLISWQCKKQTIVATSTTEAEYVAAANWCGQVLWIQNQMLDYGFNFMNTKIYIDNESTICIVKNPVFHSKTKHIAIRHHFIRDAYEKKLIQVLKIHTDENVADLLTKVFDVSSYLGFRESLERYIYGTEELLLPDLFILWLIKVSTDSAKLIPLGKDSTAFVAHTLFGTYQEA
ncbi:putative ribonuclease H-like domain-containing protein [Tanacetum coccineum]